MNVQTIIKSGRGAVNVGVETLRSANGILLDSAQTLLRTQRGARREIIEAATVSLRKARADPAEVAAKTKDELAGTLNHGYDLLKARLQGELSHKDAAAEKKARVKAKKAAKAEAAEELDHDQPDA